MLSLILGFASSLVPGLVNLFKDKQDRDHEIELAKLNLQYSDSLGKSALATAEVTADSNIQVATVTADAQIVTKAGQSIINLNASVRPIIAYLSIGVFIYAAAFKSDLLAVPLFMDVIGFVLSYFFGARCLTKRCI